MGNVRTRREASRMFDWLIRTLFSKDGASISFYELQRELKRSWEAAIEDGYVVLEGELSENRFED